MSLSDADMLEAWALLPDLIGVATGFVPGANVAGAGIGAVGSAMNFGAGVKRDGLDWGDVGSLALNLGMDALTLVPGVGSTVKLGAKLPKLLKVIPTLARIAGLYGGA
ncbi:MAG: hypothetical protein Nk1A_7690 [Endomicrobiia bacterium]|nr:MAG: hypothetical protein Nk1A_7690 [Endomicrobiia bacterium]